MAAKKAIDNTLFQELQAKVLQAQILFEEECDWMVAKSRITDARENLTNVEKWDRNSYYQSYTFV